MTTNQIPRTIPALIQLGRTVLTGAQSIGEDVELEHNSATEIAADVYDLAGNPATPLVPGKQAKYGAHLMIVKTAYQVKDDAIANGRVFCQVAIGLLKPVLGTRWNTAWQAAGFHLPSLKVPRIPTAMLTSFRNYFGSNPTRENAAANITAARAELLATAIDQAELSISQALDLRLQLKAARDAAVQQLSTRISDTRSELEQLLDDDDGRWYDFGFRRPADGRMPSPVAELTLTPGSAAMVVAQWSAATLAVNYRVTWRISGSAAEPTEVGIFTDRQCAITGLPSGTNIVVGVSARNDSGETTPKEAAIVVP